MRYDYTITKIYGEFSIDVYDKSIEHQTKKIISLLGDVNIRNTKKGSILCEYETPTIATPNVDEVSDILCEKLEPFVNEFAHFYAQNKDKCYMTICFVVYLSEEEGISIIINQRLLKLATALGVEIQFDGL